jgi:hypothetical protein
MDQSIDNLVRWERRGTPKLQKQPMYCLLLIRIVQGHFLWDLLA